MELKDLELLLAEANRRLGHSEFVIVGSLSVLGVLGKHPVPARMVLSIDVDCFTPADPDRIFDLSESLGPGSEFERAHGYYLDPVSPALPSLPDNWQHRLIRTPLAGGITASFLDPNDAAVSKYARGEPRDRQWIRAGLKAGLLSAPIIASRFRHTPFLDDAERERAHRLLAQDAAWLGRARGRG
jgi:hypothetical protein